MTEDQPEPAPTLPLFTPRSWAVAGARLDTEGALPFEKAEVTAGLELFQSAAAEPEPAAGAAAAPDGYAAWKAEMAAEKAAAEARRRSSELPVHLGEDGFALWKQEAEKARRAFEKRWGVPLGKPVRVQLRGEALEREGVLRVVDDHTQPAAATSGKHLRLTLAGHSFTAAQIESLVRL